MSSEPNPTEGCTMAAEALRASLTLPEWERGFPLALAVNHIRECQRCRDELATTTHPTTQEETP